MIQIRVLPTHHLHVYVTRNHFLKSPQVLVAKIFRGVQLRLSVALIVNVKKDIDSRYGPGTSAWKSMALTREYKKRGGTYTTNSSKRGRLAQWRKERWIQVDPPVRPNEKANLMWYMEYQTCMSTFETNHEKNTNHIGRIN